jgi:hypothetical protein
MNAISRSGRPPSLAAIADQDYGDGSIFYFGGDATSSSTTNQTLLGAGKRHIRAIEIEDEFGARTDEALVYGINKNPDRIARA